MALALGSWQRLGPKKKKGSRRWAKENETHFQILKCVWIKGSTPMTLNYIPTSGVGIPKVFQMFMMKFKIQS